MLAQHPDTPANTKKDKHNSSNSQSQDCGCMRTAQQSSRVTRRALCCSSTKRSFSKPSKVLACIAVICGHSSRFSAPPPLPPRKNNGRQNYKLPVLQRYASMKRALHSSRCHAHIAISYYFFSSAAMSLAQPEAKHSAFGRNLSLCLMAFILLFFLLGCFVTLAGNSSRLGFRVSVAPQLSLLMFRQS